MNTRVNNHRTRDGKAPTRISLFQNPLDYITEDHWRLRAMCAEMIRLAEKKNTDAQARATLIGYLDHELPLLLEDEDEALMPMVLARAEAEDEIPKLVQRLQTEHAEITAYLEMVRGGLHAADPTEGMSDALRALLTSLSGAIRRHLILENAVLLPLARARLTRSDLNRLRKRMLDRRGLKDLL